MKLNERGVTLVELLAALLLVSIVAAIAWTTISIGMRHGASETNKTIMQQDMNIIVSSLMAAHRNSEKYSITIENNRMSINACDKLGNCKLNEIASRYDFSESIIDGIEIPSLPEAHIVIADLKPSREHIKVTLKITDLNNDKNSLEVNTTLSRILSKETEVGG